MSLKIIPLEDRVIILQDESKKETEGGLLIPETAQQKPSSGTIMKVGPGKPKDKETPIGYIFNGEFRQSIDGEKVVLGDRIMPVYNMPLKEGDRVMFSFYAGQEVEEEGQKYTVMRFSDVIALF